jgi:hypothetical protein
MGEADLVASGDSEALAGLEPEAIDDAQVLVEPDGAEVKAHVVVGAQAQDVGQHVRAVVGVAKWPNVRSLGVPAAANLDG